MTEEEKIKKLFKDYSAYLEDNYIPKKTIQDYNLANMVHTSIGLQKTIDKFVAFLKKVSEAKTQREFIEL